MNYLPVPEEQSEPDHPAAYALAKHIADHSVSTIQAAFRYLNSPIAFEAHEDPAPAPTPSRRAEVSAKLWEIAEQFIIAEWICCEPLDPKHGLCAKGYAALDMAKTLLVDSDPAEAWNPAAPVLDAVMGLLGTDERIVDDLNKANVTLARALDVREEQLGRYLTLLQLEHQRITRVREELASLTRGAALFDYDSSHILHRIEDALGEDPDPCAEGHIYLSTGCMHGAEGHAYCQSMTGLQGVKRGGKCKWCDAQCICACHADEEKAPQKTTLQELPCNHARTHWPHVPHDWEPQPDMDKVHCIGHPEGSCNEACPPRPGGSVTDRLICPGPYCGEDVTDYDEDDHVFLKGDDRPFCSGECVVAVWRAMQKGAS